jgi:enoyl-CoA hydratase
MRRAATGAAIGGGLALLAAGIHAGAGGTELARLLILGVALGAVAATDLTEHRIPNQAFCLGMDLRKRNEMTKEQWLRQRANIDRLIYTVRQLRRPIFAAGGRVNPRTSGRGRSSVRSCARHCSPRHIQAGSQ